MLMHEELTFEGSGRLSVETRMKMIHGEVIILKAKSSIKVTLTMMVSSICISVITTQMLISSQMNYIKIMVMEHLLMSQ